MKKEEFFAKIRAALSGMDEEIARDILEDYETHFQEALNSGMSEEEICEELGDAEELEAALREENPNVPARAHDVRRMQREQEADIVKEADSEVQLVVDAKKVYAGITAVQTELKSVSLQLEPSADNLVTMEICCEGSREELEKLKRRLLVSAGGGRLTIREKGEQISSRSVFRGLQSIFRGNAASIRLRIPAGTEELSAESMSGDITAENCGFKTWQSESRSGDVHLKNCSCQKTALQTMSGDIELIGNQSTELWAKTISGDIRVEESQATKFGLVTTSGDISGVLPAEAKCRIRSVSGDCRIRLGEHACVETETTSGDITLELKEGSSARVKSVSGDTTICCSNHGRGCRAQLKTGSGDLCISYGGDRQEGQKQLSFSQGNEDCVITAQSVSGDVCVKD